MSVCLPVGYVIYMNVNVSVYNMSVCLAVYLSVLVHVSSIVTRSMLGIAGRDTGSRGWEGAL